MEYLLSKILKRENILHNVLNAKYHAQEADIIAQAGRRVAVTIATNMAGRGTDIKLEDGVSELGGLLVLGTERHESRRIDRQLRGRCARQGDPGCSKFFVSLEDNLMRLFASSGPIASLLHKTFKDGDVLEHPLLNRSIQKEQKKVEEYHYSMRKRLLQYDDVLNKQREVIYSLRNDVLHNTSTKELLFEMLADVLKDQCEECLANDDFVQLAKKINQNFPVVLDESFLRDKSSEEIVSEVLEKIRTLYALKEEAEGAENIAQIERFVILYAIDHNWQNHLTEMDELRNSVGLRGYGQRDPLNEYKNEDFTCFELMLKAIRNDICFRIFRSSSNPESFNDIMGKIANNLKLSGVDHADDKADEKQKMTIAVRPQHSIGRNDLCPCGSGKKYKKCCGRE